MARTKKCARFSDPFLSILGQYFNWLEEPLRMLGIVAIFFGSSPMVIEWDATWIPLRKDQKQQSVLIQA